VRARKLAPRIGQVPDLPVIARCEPSRGSQVKRWCTHPLKPSPERNAYDEVLKVLQLTPWNGQPQHESNPDGAVRRWMFGAGQAGQLVYLIIEERLEVHLLLVQWWG
jgi:hypothetical protein